MSLRHLISVAYVALMDILDEEARAAWHAEVEPGTAPKQVERPKPKSRNVRALMQIAGGMPRG